MKELKKHILSIHALLALIFTVVAVIYLPDFVNSELSKSLLSIGTSVLALVFSISFAALAFIISASDDKFVVFLEKEGAFSELINTFKWTLLSLSLALIYTLLLYITIAFRYSRNHTFEVHEVTIWIFCFLFFYSLFGSMINIRDTIIYSRNRLEYLEIMERNKNAE